ncbi:hypothetical protein NDU88_006970 [Pleurodeles waltl]|uniref:Uncharacterized protein n=1 Tax=Pleurodeles waltl TaxID=8319 RepID=A0AAV7URM0_PLEWA|nr:hypothetical protein NDU88_006970 [Pleurodeles waltl]
MNERLNPSGSVNFTQIWSLRAALLRIKFPPQYDKNMRSTQILYLKLSGSETHVLLRSQYSATLHSRVKPARLSSSPGCRLLLAAAEEQPPGSEIFSSRCLSGGARLRTLPSEAAAYVLPVSGFALPSSSRFRFPLLLFTS